MLSRRLSTSATEAKGRLHRVTWRAPDKSVGMWRQQVGHCRCPIQAMPERNSQWVTWRHFARVLQQVVQVFMSSSTAFLILLFLILRFFTSFKLPSIHPWMQLYIHTSIQTESIPSFQFFFFNWRADWAIRSCHAPFPQSRTLTPLSFGVQQVLQWTATRSSATLKHLGSSCWEQNAASKVCVCADWKKNIQYITLTTYIYVYAYVCFQ